MLKQKFLMSSAALLIAGVISAGAVFGDDSITGGQNLTAGENAGQELNSGSDNAGNGPEGSVSESADAPDENAASDNSVDPEDPSENGSPAEDGTGSSGIDSDDSDADGTDTDGTDADDSDADGTDADDTNTDGTNAGGESDDNINTPDKPMTVELSGQYLTVSLNDPDGHSSASAAIWSEAGGQDDIVWYTMTKQADGSFAVSADLGLHGTAGKYNIHIYSGNDFIAGESVVLESFESPEMVVAPLANNESSFAVFVRNAEGYSNVKAAVWGAKNGQNDLKWYDLKDSGNGTLNAVIDLARHGENGTFYFHVYGTANGIERFLDGKEQVFNGDGLAEPSVTIELEGQILKVTAENADAYSDVKAAVWSEAGGQDDLVWYKLAKNSDGIFKTDVNLTTHKSTGRFIIHVYGGNTCIGGGTVMPDSSGAEMHDSSSKPVLKAEKVKDSESRFTLTVEDAQGFSNVRAAVWGEKNGQNDLKWYTLKDLGNGIFKTEIDLLAHKETGSFCVHVYGTVNGTESFMDGKKLELTGIDIPEPKLESELNGQDAVITLNQAQEYSSARAAIWSEINGQDDLVWYPMTGNADGSFKLEVNLGTHRSTGRFNIHVYSGNSYIAGTSLELETAEAPALHVEESEDAPFVVTVSVSNALGFKNVRAAVWGSKNYQNDIKWYELENAGDGLFRAEIDLSAHGEEGYYYVHVYGENAGAEVFVDGLIMDAKVPDANAEKVMVNADAVAELARRSGDEELNVLFIGNSITVYAVSDEWPGLWGMGATDEDKDYVHVITNSFNEHINTHFDIYHFAPWELEDYDRDSLLPNLDVYLCDKYDLIVIQLGDNVRYESDMQADYEALFRYCRAKAPKAKIVTVGNFWTKNAADEGKSAACTTTGVSLVDLRDIRSDMKYSCGMGTLVSGEDGNKHPVTIDGVALHPGNYGMDKIGKRVIRAALAN